MNRKPRLRILIALAGVYVLALNGLAGCGRGDDAKKDGDGDTRTVVKTSATERAERRGYDGAPPVIPHEMFGVACMSCHNDRGMEVEGVGFAPPMPHEVTAGLSDVARCRQCHVFRETDEVFVASDFRGLAQDLRQGRRLNDMTPPVIPHPVFMRENCYACHAGTAAREEIRCSHPERARCQQCHVEENATDLFTP